MKRKRTPPARVENATRLLAGGRPKKVKGVKPWKSHPHALAGETNKEKIP